jgi:hypothetical protein
VHPELFEEGWADALKHEKEALEGAEEEEDDEESEEDDDDDDEEESGV